MPFSSDTTCPRCEVTLNSVWISTTVFAKILHPNHPLDMRYGQMLILKNVHRALGVADQTWGSAITMVITKISGLHPEVIHQMYRQNLCIRFSIQYVQFSNAKNRPFWPRHGIAISNYTDWERHPVPDPPSQRPLSLPLPTPLVYTPRRRYIRSCR